jgi:hypothetical protein
MALSGLMSTGMKDQAYRTLWGVYHASYETKGYWFRTPEAWDISGDFRASMYIRPAAIWTMEMMPEANSADRTNRCARATRKSHKFPRSAKSPSRV